MRHTLANVCKNKYDCREIFSYKKRKKETEKWAPPVLFVCYEFLSSCFTLEWNFKGVCRTDIYLKCDIACTCWIFEKISSIFYFQDLLFLSIRIINVIEWKTVLSLTTCRIKKAKKKLRDNELFEKDVSRVFIQPSQFHPSHKSTVL